MQVRGDREGKGLAALADQLDTVGVAERGDGHPFRRGNTPGSRFKLEARREVVGAGFVGPGKVAGIPIAENGDGALQDLAAWRGAGWVGEVPQLGHLANLPAVLVGKGGEGLGLARQRPQLRQGAPIAVQRLHGESLRDGAVHIGPEVLLPNLLEAGQRVLALGELDEVLEESLVGPQGTAREDQIAAMTIRITPLVDAAHLEIVLRDTRLSQGFPSLEGLPQPVVYGLLQIAHAHPLLAPRSSPGGSPSFPADAFRISSFEIACSAPNCSRNPGKTAVLRLRRRPSRARKPHSRAVSCALRCSPRPPGGAGFFTKPESEDSGQLDTSRELPNGRRSISIADDPLARAGAARPREQVSYGGWGKRPVPTKGDG